VWEKALDIYAEVIMRLEDKGIPHRAVVVGEGPARLGMRALIPNALFLGSLSGPELARAYASSDVFLFPSHTETFGITTLEAMSSGLAVSAPPPCVHVIACRDVASYELSPVSLVG
jgi:phosphatidylinositol alpha 1,6-mannosyltransferase